MSRILALAAASLLVACGGGGESPTTPSGTPLPGPTAQTTLTLSGRVTESPPTSATPIGGATVTIGDGPHAGQATMADQDGRFTFSGLSVSGFTATASAPGYQSRGSGINLTSNQTLDFQLAPDFRMEEIQLEDEVNGGSPVCPDGNKHSSKPCREYPIAVHNAGRLTAVLTWDGTTSAGAPRNDLDLALLRAPRRNPEDRIAISRSDTLREEVIADLSPGVQYYVHVLYDVGSTPQRFTLRVSKPN